MTLGFSDGAAANERIESIEARCWRVPLDEPLHDAKHGAYDRYTTRPLRLREYRALVPDVPGTGVEFDWGRLEAVAPQTCSAR